MNQFDSEPILASNADPKEPVFSPDGAWLAYFANGGRILQKVAISGGAPVTLAELPSEPDGAAWQDGALLFAMNAAGASGIFSVPDTGGPLRQIVTADPAVERLSQPRLIGDGRHVLFTVTAPRSIPGEGVIVAQALDTGQRTVLVKGGTGAQALATGHLVYLHDDSLFGLRFDARTLKVGATPVRLVEGLVGSGGGQFAVSASGTLIYQAVETPSPRTLVWVDRRGSEQPMGVAPADYLDPRISPDGTRLAVSLSADIWIALLAKPVFQRLTFTASGEYNPIWSRDGRHVIFDSRDDEGRVQITRKLADGTGTPEVVVPALAGYPNTVSADDKLLVYHTAAQRPVAMLWSGTTPAQPLIKSAAPTRSFNAEISPDGRWIAYQSDESGRYLINVHPFPRLQDGRWEVSISGGSYPLWARSGRELFFIGSTGTLMSVPISLAPTFTHGAPVPLFSASQYPCRRRPQLRRRR